MTIPDYIVLRAGKGLSESFMPEHLEGRWYDKNDIPTPLTVNENLKGTGAVAVPIDRFEVREDGAVAQVWELQC